MLPFWRAAAIVAPSLGFLWTRSDAEKKKRIVVVGGGIVGASAAYSLATRGHDVTLIDSGDSFRSSWGESRIARLSQHTPMKLQMMERAKLIWERLEHDAGQMLFKTTGMLDIGTPSQIASVQDTYDRCGIAYERFDPESIKHSYPQLGLKEGQVALFQKDGWLVLASECLNSLWDCTSRFRNSRFLEADAAVKINRTDKTVTTSSGEKVPYDKLILSCGPWTNAVLKMADLSLLPLAVTSEQQTYFATESGREECYDWDHMPVIIDRGPSEIYALPHVVGGAEGVKVSKHGGGPILENSEHVIKPGFPPSRACKDHPFKVHEKKLSQEFTSALDEAMSSECAHWCENHLPGIESSRLLHHYRYTVPYEGDPDAFVMGEHPQDSTILVCCGFAGEGFKFGTCMGEAVADLAVGSHEKVAGMRRSFSLDRFKGIVPSS